MKPPKQQQILTSIFGDLSDDDDNENDHDDIDEQIRKIFDSIRTPEMLSPIKDWHENVTSPSPSPSPSPPMPMDTQEPSPEESLEHLNAKNEIISSDINNSSSVNTKCDVDHPNSSVECNTEEMIVLDDFSPASPKPEDQTSSTDPPVIPTNTISDQIEMQVNVDESSNISTDSPLDQIIYNYVPSIRNEVLMCNPNLSNAECYLLASLRNAIEKYCIVKEWTTSATTECVDRLLSISRQPKHLATAILEVVEDTKESLSVEFTPPAPVLQPSHQKCLVLVSRLTKFMSPFNQYVQFELERRLFKFTNEEKSIDVMTNLTHFYISLIDIEQPTDRAKVRLFIYKCLYYFKSSSVPLIFTVIMAHPYSLPHANAIESIDDPLIRALACALSNIVYFNLAKNHDIKFKKNELFHTLKRRYGFFADKIFSFDVTVDYCIECIRMNRLQNVDYALILIAKRKDHEYAAKKIIEKHLSPMLHQLFTTNLNESTEHDRKICTILFIIGSIVKTFPIEQNVSGYLKIFAACLNATERQSIQEAAIIAICQMNRFGIAKIYPYLAAWKPNYKISTQIQAIFKTIVYKKPKAFWFDENKS